MRTHLEFRSERFGGQDARPNRYNSEIRGGELADFLGTEFAQRGFNGEVIEEDWGWMVALKSEPFGLWLGCANYGDEDNWLVFIKPSKPVVRKWLKKFDTRDEVEAVARHLEEILVDIGRSTNMTWWSDEDSGRK